MLRHHKHHGIWCGAERVRDPALLLWMEGDALVVVSALYLVVFGQTISDRFLEIVTYQLQDIEAQLVPTTACRSSVSMSSAFREHATTVPPRVRWCRSTSQKPVQACECWSPFCAGCRDRLRGISFQHAISIFTLWMMFRRLSASVQWERVWRSRGRNGRLDHHSASPSCSAGLSDGGLREHSSCDDLGILATRDSEFAAGDFHTMVGLFRLIPAFLIYMGIV